MNLKQFVRGLALLLGIGYIIDNAEFEACHYAYTLEEAWDWVRQYPKDSATYITKVSSTFFTA